MAAPDLSQCLAVEGVPGKRSGAWVFKDTRTPVSVVFDNLQDGATIDEVMDWFRVTREQVWRCSNLRRGVRTRLLSKNQPRGSMLILFGNGTLAPLRHAPKGMSGSRSEDCVRGAREPALAYAAAVRR